MTLGTELLGLRALCLWLGVTKQEVSRFVTVGLIRRRGSMYERESVEQLGLRLRARFRARDAMERYNDLKHTRTFLHPQIEPSYEEIAYEKYFRQASRRAANLGNPWDPIDYAKAFVAIWRTRAHAAKATASHGCDRERTAARDSATAERTTSARESVRSKPN